MLLILTIRESFAEDIRERDEAAVDDNKPIMMHHEQEVQQYQSTEEKVLDDADVLLNRIARALGVKIWLGWTDPKWYHERAQFSFEHPCSYQPPYRRYGDGQSDRIIHKHLDVFHRGYKGRDDDQLLDPIDGRVRRLFVQVTNQIYEEPNDTTWRRTYIRNISPHIIRLAWWPYAKAPLAQASYSSKGGLRARFKARTAAWTNEHWTSVGLRWIPACVGLLVMVSFGAFTLKDLY